MLVRHEPVHSSDRGVKRHAAPVVAALVLTIGFTAFQTRTIAQNRRVLKPVPTTHVVAHLSPQLADSLTPGVGGTWSALANLPPAAVDNCLLLTDATVFCHQNGGRNWYRLTPNNTGSYQQGTWTLDSSMQSGYAPLYFASAVLPDGRVLVEGGEYNCNPGCTSSWQTQGSLYDPATRTWTAVAPPPNWSTIGDAQSVILANGTLMLADCCSGRSAFFNAATKTWTEVTGHQIDNYNDEENYSLLPDGRVLTVDAWPANSRLSEIFDPITQQWTSAGNTPVLLTDNNGSNPSYEQGPGVLRPDGTVFYFGANASGAGHTASYNTLNSTWTIGPDFPNGDDAADAPAVLLPSGNILAQASPGVFGTPSRWYELDFSTNTFTQVTSPSYSFSPSSYYGQMLVLPTGQILQTEFSNDVRLYTPAGTYNPNWAPTISSVASTLAPGSSYAISGTQFNGLSQGAAYGDDWQSATNYPIVRITNTSTGHVFYAKTHDHSSMGVATGGALVSTTFDVPSSIETGASTLEVVANGIPSSTVSVTIGSGTAAPGAFSKIAPANGSTSQPASLLLSWGSSTGATAYEYCIDTTNDNACGSTWLSAGAATSVGVSSLAAGTTYYWEVRAVNAGGTTAADASAWWTFTTAAPTLPGAFSKTAPANNATGLGKNITLSWASSSGATSYEYCMDTTNDNVCSGTWTSTGTATSVRRNNLASRTKYYWQVRARNSAGTTDANSLVWWTLTTK